MAVKGELEVLAGATKLLSANGNALDNYGKRSVLAKVVACCEISGNVNEVNSLLLGRNDLCNAALDLHHAGVRSCRTGNKNGHTNLDAEISNGVCFHLVGVVATYNVLVSEEEVVSGVACCLRVNSNNDTLNNKVVTFLSCHVLLEGGYLELRNEVLVLSGESLALLVGYGELKGVGDVFIGSAGNNYGNGKAILAGLKRNLAVGYFPLNSVGLVTDLNFTCNGIVSAGYFCDGLSHLVYVVVCQLKVSINLGGFILAAVITFVAEDLAKAGDLSKLVTAYHEGESKKENEN